MSTKAEGGVLRATITVKDALTYFAAITGVAVALLGVIYNDATRRISKVEDGVDELTQAFNDFRVEVQKNASITLK